MSRPSRSVLAAAGAPRPRHLGRTASGVALSRAARRAGFAAAVMLAMLSAVMSSPPTTNAAAGDIGFEGPSTLNGGTSPTGSKPESKLWWNDGFWWASMWDTRSADFHIFKLAPATQTWTDTGVKLDDRTSTRADILWDGTAGKLYVASHRFSESPASGYPSRLYRYSYNAATDTYTKDSGFPVVINNYRLETLVIDKDSTGRLWATWTQGGKVWINATVCSPACNDAKWGTAFSLAVPAVKADDISSLIAFGGNRIGLMWSNQNNATDWFAVHTDGAADDAWAVEPALSGTGMADDHINLKTDSAGRVYAAVKTARTGANDPLTLLLVRATGGGWSQHTFGRVADHHTRPMVLIDEADRVIHMFATSAESGGSIMEKTSPLDAIEFPSGVGTEVVRDADGLVNDATSAKRNVTRATGLVVAANSNQHLYFHGFEDLSGGGATPPVAGFDATPSSGTAPLDVQFTDTSNGTVDSWAWDFDNDGTVDSTQQNPSWTYTEARTYTAKLTVTNSAGPDSATHSIVVTEPGSGSQFKFGPHDDAYVRSSAPNGTSGALADLRVYKSSTLDTQTYLRFVVSGTTGPVTSATLRLFVTDGSPDSGTLYSVPETSWTEATLTYSTRPPVGGLVAGAEAAPLGEWIEFDVTGLITGDGAYSLALKDAPATAYYSSKEGANPPQLVVTTGPG